MKLDQTKKSFLGVSKMHNIKKHFVYLILAIVGVGLLFFISFKFILACKYIYQTGPAVIEYSLPKISINEKEIFVKIADTPEKHAAGLSGVEHLPQDIGMLFVFDQPQQVGIWMKDMKISLDIIWFDENFEVIRIEENAVPESYPLIFYPDKEAKYVLEVNTGFIKDNNVRLGDKIHFR
jgi:uncharacterized membrane protein (UPF0127 family)